MEKSKADISAGVDGLKQLPTNEDIVVDEEEHKYRFGCGPCRPACLQIFRNSIFFTFILCLNVIVEGSIVLGIFYILMLVYAYEVYK